MSDSKTTSVGLVCAPSDLRHVEDIVTRSGTSFARGMKILPPARRQGMFAVYAFCRLVDDIADGDTDHADPMQALDAWRRRIAALYEGKTSDALDRVLLTTIERYHLRQEDFTAVIDGMAMDCGKPIVAPDEKTLDHYCDCVASAVGRLSSRIFGMGEPEGDRLAYHLGRALQITNILRDIGEDAQRGRLYLPAELLQRFSVPKEPSKALYAPGLDGLCRIMAMRASDHFRAAERIMNRGAKEAVRPARIMAASYKVTLAALKKRGWHHPNAPLHVCSMRKKLGMLLACFGVSV
ncbi:MULTISPECIES: presqualene diphosphate synthase HpnD [unclassified Saccharibacter]|uniref:presqualene diphosphate synthase HpnD n=1 Tax=unclassified Saccharibacter TaxID=2648722 RepID=UPI0013292630|nr:MULTISPECIES: presqualene diphosphate synthase HpnD [unclassified Saccharibacter]MXV36257.1 presqualene diphosphate synthase HpnD [Saccharibacter sp. EH611]MXV57117.1 presqualene diphosphate synthase HpnD [Saccharibacter sp. EH70]MXV66523.1 presqualene diphosphate synthase HpnD [Saccharibacter sp. EH60]